MRRRKVTDEAIDWVLQHHHTQRDARPLAKRKPAEIYIGEYQGRRLKVYVEKDTQPPKVKTAVWED